MAALFFAFLGNALFFGADTKSTPCLSSDLHLSVIKIRPKRGQLICLKICSKRSKIRKKVDNGPLSLFFEHIVHPNVANLVF